MKAIEVKELTKTVEDGDVQKTIVQPTSFSIEAGEFVAIIGPSGSGKSTLLTMLAGLQSSTEGDVWINGTSLMKMKEKAKSQLRFEEIGFILQSSNLIPYLNVEEQFKLIDQVRHTVRDEVLLNELLETLDIKHLLKKMPHDISGGERQRVAIAKALYQKPTVILADEPTASLDSERSEEVVSLLQKETKEHQKATVMVTHDEQLTKYCDRILVMKDGVLTEKNREL